MLRPGQLFDDVVKDVLKDPEFGDVSESEAQAERDAILGRTQEAQTAYQHAVTRARLEFWLRRGLVAAGALPLLMLLTAAVTAGWSNVLKDALADGRPVSVWSIAGETLAGFLAFFGLAAAVAFVLWWVYYLLSRDARAGVPVAKGRQLLFSLGIPYFLLTPFCAVLIGVYPAHIAWQLQHNRPLPEDAAHSWEWFILGALVLAALPPLSLRRLASAASRESLSLSYLIAVLDTRERKQAEAQAKDEWREAVKQALLSFVRELISQRAGRLFSTVLAISDAPGLRQLRADREHVATRADRQLAMISAGMESGSIALSGPRGVGKTQLLRNFCKVDKGKLSLVEPVPVLFDRREFMLHLFYKLCDLVIKEGLGTAQEAERHKRSIRYLQTQSDEAALSAGWRSWNLSAKRASSLAEQPQTYPEIVDALKKFLGATALELRKEKKPRRLVIGIDELDRIEPAVSAHTFLNELKAVFDIPNCLFVLSVSDEALRDAELAPVGRRDAFDSAIDEVVRVEPLDQKRAERLLARRVTRLPIPFAALFYCLSGGMPRDLLRTARAAIAYVSQDQPRSLTYLTGKLVEREVDRIANAAGGSDEHAQLAQLFRRDVVADGGLAELGDLIHQQAGAGGDRARMGATLANRAYYLDTVQRIFTDALTLERFTDASDESDPGPFSALARAQREIGTADTLARSTLQRVRTAWSLPALPPAPPV
ncbi:P-loop NTPase fold protein [Streptomyces cyaneus]|uniref:P-loop NTPase fold protein n=1 Tax=Streptomyces cyaneus TaxID=1904 RepID=UPI001FE9127E|nr:P-loop NTPase fold protein [Streptomyces cyaneus]